MANKELSPLQIEAVHLWVGRKAAGLTGEDIARQLGIDRRTLYRWRQTAAWRRYESEQALQNAKSHLNDVLETVVEKAIAGSGKHAELYLKVCGLIGNDALKNAKEIPVEDNRSNEAMEKELEELHRLLEQTQEGYDRN